MRGLVEVATLELIKTMTTIPMVRTPMYTTLMRMRLTVLKRPNTRKIRLFPICIECGELLRNQTSNIVNQLPDSRTKSVTSTGSRETSILISFRSRFSHFIENNGFEVHTYEVTVKSAHSKAGKLTITLEDLTTKAWDRVENVLTDE